MSVFHPTAMMEHLETYLNKLAEDYFNNNVFLFISELTGDKKTNVQIHQRMKKETKGRKKDGEIVKKEKGKDRISKGGWG